MTGQWVDKHRPETLDDVQANNSDLDSIKSWADDWSYGDEAILLVGPPGVGKTSTAEAVANRLGVQTVEVNASSARDTEALRGIAQQIRTTGEGGRRLILIDEVDSWHHGPDKSVLYDALDEPGNPVVMTANDEYDVANGLKRRAETFEFSLGVRSRKSKIRDVAEAEGLNLDSHEIETLAKRPDLRSAINDMELHAQTDGVITGDRREWEEDEWDTLDDLLTGTPTIGSMSPDDALMWVDECLSAAYRGLEMSMGYEALALADGRLRAARDGSYRQWRYARAIIEEVGPIRQTEPYFGDEISYKDKSFPEWFRHSAPRATGDSPEARLYRQLKGTDDSGLGFQGNYIEFRQSILPLLTDLDDEDRYQIALRHGLDDDEMDVLDVDPVEYEDWLEVQAPEEGEWQREVQSGAEW